MRLSRPWCQLALVEVRGHADDPHTLLLMAPGWAQTDLGGPADRLTIGQSIPGVVDTIEAQGAKGGLRYLDY